MSPNRVPEPTFLIGRSCRQAKTSHCLRTVCALGFCHPEQSWKYQRGPRTLEIICTNLGHGLVMRNALSSQLRLAETKSKRLTAEQVYPSRSLTAVRIPSIVSAPYSRAQSCHVYSPPSSFSAALAPCTACHFRQSSDSITGAAGRGASSESMDDGPSCGWRLRSFCRTMEVRSMKASSMEAFSAESDLRSAPLIPV
jgi:hypothetical protein